MDQPKKVLDKEGNKFDHFQTKELIGFTLPVEPGELNTFLDSEWGNKSREELVTYFKDVFRPSEGIVKAWVFAVTSDDSGASLADRARIVDIQSQMSTARIFLENKIADIS